ncbi:sensor histidine kinase [Paenibacillus sp. HJGM_3]|uniref:sensor histidine kinase n=1 Tax=Paenibacillus sp. HJGM_3 TaxID=3379816 RepID=UPI00386C2461
MRFLKRSIRNQLVVFLLVATIVPIGVSMYITYVYTREDEIGHLSRRFQSMMNTINDLILREYRLELANKTTQLRMLQAQINPHFINNALQSIGTLALQHEAPKVYALLASLAKMMHYTMHTDETIVPLEKELEHLNYYLQLQKQRFDDKFSYRYDIGEATRTIPVPKMILQPIAENYFKHGYSAHNEGGRLQVTTELRQDRLYIRMTDNGTGMPEEELRRLQLELETPRDEGDRSEHIGLANVMDRLRLYYGDQASMLLLHTEPHGLTVVLTIPVRDEGGWA